jgi:murein DD-endopeptidase MepM/ murein hydrolase activator NlpD
MSRIGNRLTFRQNTGLVMPYRTHRLLIAFLLIGTICLVRPGLLLAQATDSTPAPPIPRVHTVQEGENLTSIAAAFEVSVEDILAINNLANGDLLQIGQELIIPGGTGDVIATVHTVLPGDTLRGIAAEYNSSIEEIIDTNRLIRRDLPLVIGQSMPVISRTGSVTPRPMSGRPHLVQSGESLFTIAARYGLTPAVLADLNGLVFPVYLHSGMRLRIPDETSVYRDLPAGWLEVGFNPDSLTQGGTLAISTAHLLDGVPAGRFGNQPLQFAPQDDGYVALVGIDAFTEAGIFEMALTGGDERGLWEPLRLLVPVGETGFDTQYVTVGEELGGLLDPNVRSTEDEFFREIYTVFEPTQLWSGAFQMPVATTIISAGYGGGRSYNDGPVEIFHTGVDFAAPIGEPVLAPADGVVVFADQLELRGLSAIVNHGMGVMTGYYHLSELAVQPGDTVVAGQPLGAVGNTGLSSGAHLHWDLRIMNVPVDGLQWTRQSFP